MLTHTSKFNYSHFLSMQAFNGPRCDLLENIIAHGCSAETVITARSSMMMERVSLLPSIKMFLRLWCWAWNILLVPHVQNQGINVKLLQSQVSPQQMSMSFLPGEERQMDVEVFAPTKGPLDLYILMDFSNSMADDLDNLKRMGKELGQCACFDNCCIVSSHADGDDNVCIT